MTSSTDPLATPLDDEPQSDPAQPAPAGQPDEEVAPARSTDDEPAGSGVEGAAMWWDNLSGETQALLREDPRRDLPPDVAGEVQRAGTVLITDDTSGEIRTLLPDSAVDYIESHIGTD